MWVICNNAVYNVSGLLLVGCAPIQWCAIPSIQPCICVIRFAFSKHILWQAIYIVRSYICIFYLSLMFDFLWIFLPYEKYFIALKIDGLWLFVCMQFIFSTAIDGKIKAWLYDLAGSRMDIILQAYGALQWLTSKPGCMILRDLGWTIMLQAYGAPQ